MAEELLAPSKRYYHYADYVRAKEANPKAKMGPPTFGDPNNVPIVPFEPGRTYSSR